MHAPPHVHTHMVQIIISRQRAGREIKKEVVIDLIFLRILFNMLQIQVSSGLHFVIYSHIKLDLTSHLFNAVYKY